MSERDLYLIGDIPGFTPQIGRLVSMMSLTDAENHPAANLFRRLGFRRELRAGGLRQLQACLCIHEMS